MKRKMVLGVLVFLLVLQAQTVFAQSNNDFQLGEDEPLLEGTIWADSENTKNFEVTYEFRTGGRLISKIQAHAGSSANGTYIGKWSRKGNVVRMVFPFGAYEGKYYPQSQRIMANYFNQNGEMGKDYTLVPFQGSSITSAPTTPAPTQQPAAPAQSTTNVYVQPSAPAQPAPAPVQSAPAGWVIGSMLSGGANNIGGTWRGSVGSATMVLNGNGAASGSVIINVNGKQMTGTATVSGNSLNLYITSGEYSGQQFRYTIVTNKLIQGDGENFSRY